MAAELLGVAYSTLTRYWSIALSEENITIRGVYGIFDQEKIIYIGSSENVRKRLKQHEWIIQEALEPNSTSEVAKYLRKYPEAKLTYKVFADGRDIGRADMLQLEKDLISFLQPCCNTMSK